MSDKKSGRPARIFMAPADLMQVYNSVSGPAGKGDISRTNCVPMRMHATTGRTAGRGDHEILADYRSVLYGLTIGSGLTAGQKPKDLAYLDDFKDRVNARNPDDREKFKALWGADKTGMQMTIIRAADAGGRATHLYVVHDDMRGMTVAVGKDGLAEDLRRRMTQQGLTYLSADMPQAREKAGAMIEGFYTEAAAYRNDARFYAALSLQNGRLDDATQEQLRTEAMWMYERVQQSGELARQALLSVVVFRDRDTAHGAKKLGDLMVQAAASGRPVICTSVSQPDRARSPVWGRSSAWKC